MKLTKTKLLIQYTIKELSNGTIDLTSPYLIERCILENEIGNARDTSRYIFKNIDEVEDTLYLINSGIRTSKRIKNNVHVYFAIEDDEEDD